jgi:hypothetical protein
MSDLLAWHVQKGDISEIRSLLERHPNPQEVINYHGHVLIFPNDVILNGLDALHIASIYGHLDIARFFVINHNMNSHNTDMVTH